ncbi:unnamed protein product [marine sediment metagenome]|uniref:Type 4 fimbrial biogenesis protein PilX N-terminal domain-containing protein n=1 Tax=marine sediment metagenome TaxID=412755 RepID=X0S1L8_9ZZZZ
MVVVAIIGVLALLGLRLYTGQQEKAKNAIVKANCGTIQTLIQAELADNSLSDVWADVETAGAAGLFGRSGIHNPLGGAQTDNIVTGAATRPTASTANDGEVYVMLDNATIANATHFVVNGIATNATDNVVFDTDLTARR